MNLIVVAFVAGAVYVAYRFVTARPNPPQFPLGECPERSASLRPSDAVPLTWEEARDKAIKAGALEPQGFAEGGKANWEKSKDWSFKWANTPTAQNRLKACTNQILERGDYRLPPRT